MPFPTAPITRILTFMQTIAVEAELHIAFDMDEPFTVRQHRHRISQSSERPAMALRLVNIEQAGDLGGSQWEIGWQATIDVIVDMDLPPEGEGDTDPTGWNNVAGAANAFANLYLADDSRLRAMVDDITPGDVDPDEDSKPDDGRLAQSVVVLYRTPWNDLNRLLSPEENVT